MYTLLLLLLFLGSISLQSNGNVLTLTNNVWSEITSLDGGNVFISHVSWQTNRTFIGGTFSYLSSDSSSYSYSLAQVLSPLNEGQADSLTPYEHFNLELGSSVSSIEVISTAEQPESQTICLAGVLILQGNPVHVACYNTTSGQHTFLVTDPPATANSIRAGIISSTSLTIFGTFTSISCYPSATRSCSPQNDPPPGMGFVATVELSTDPLLWYPSDSASVTPIADGSCTLHDSFRISPSLVLAVCTPVRTYFDAATTQSLVFNISNCGQHQVCVTSLPLPSGVRMIVYDIEPVPSTDQSIRIALAGTLLHPSSGSLLLFSLDSPDNVQMVPALEPVWYAPHATTYPVVTAIVTARPPDGQIPSGSYLVAVGCFSHNGAPQSFAWLNLTTFQWVYEAEEHGLLGIAYSVDPFAHVGIIDSNTTLLVTGFDFLIPNGYSAATWAMLGTLMGFSGLFGALLIRKLYRRCYLHINPKEWQHNTHQFRWTVAQSFGRGKGYFMLLVLLSTAMYHDAQPLIRLRQMHMAAAIPLTPLQIRLNTPVDSALLGLVLLAGLSGVVLAILASVLSTRVLVLPVVLIGTAGTFIKIVAASPSAVFGGTALTMICATGIVTLAVIHSVSAFMSVGGVLPNTLLIFLACTCFFPLVSFMPDINVLVSLHDGTAYLLYGLLGLLSIIIALNIVIEIPVERRFPFQAKDLRQISWLSVFLLIVLYVFVSECWSFVVDDRSFADSSLSATEQIVLAVLSLVIMILLQLLYFVFTHRMGLRSFMFVVVSTTVFFCLFPMVDSILWAAQATTLVSVPWQYVVTLFTAFSVGSLNAGFASVITFLAYVVPVSTRPLFIGICISAGFMVPPGAMFVLPLHTVYFPMTPWQFAYSFIIVVSMAAVGMMILASRASRLTLQLTTPFQSGFESPKGSETEHTQLISSGNAAIIGSSSTTNVSINASDSMYGSTVSFKCEEMSDDPMNQLN